MNAAQLLIEQSAELQFWFLELPLVTRRRVSAHVLNNETMAARGMDDHEIEKRNRELMGSRCRAWLKNLRDKQKANEG